MDNTTIKKRPLPWSPTKSDVLRIYVKLNKVVVQDEIWEVMMQHRKKTRDQVKNKRILFHPEFVAIVKLFGIPQGYYAPDGFFQEPV
ncbi:hypothetical protein U6A24_12700 [Aquimarina gracilis]|uniref:Uncharacterized protein n=1 Tax=Aquimarina gracilis TaxID=874422 RepID=A0ABU5ZWS0_9FLAO|nr:hypothetical protein [Aquimarina gracilis]MEB3346329.1 hypothetical protein [Aquimarina gracilis]